MSIADFFDHTCDIYHQDGNEQGTAYSGLDTQKVKKYQTTPEIADIDCHFSLKDENTNMAQGKPQRTADIFDTLALPVGTDVRTNDKIHDKTHNVYYTVAKPPKNIRGNHIKAKLWMLEPQQDL